MSPSARRSLRVLVPDELRQLSARTGHGRMWRNVLSHLGTLTDVRFVRAGSLASERGPRRKPYAWLGDGQAGPLPVAGPQAFQVHEAGWDTPELAATIAPAFLARLESSLRASTAVARRIIVPSRSARDQVAAAFDVEPARIRAVPHGVDTATFSPGRVGAHALLERSGADPHLPYVLFVSTLHPRKNLAALREAMQRLGHAGHPHQLVIVAEAPPDRSDHCDIERRALAPLDGVANPVVRVERPSDKELAALMAGSAAFCLPSLMEGFGLTVLEAMASGTAVVVSDRGPLPELVGDTGLVVEPTAPAIEAALSTLLLDAARAKALGAAASRRAASFGWDRTAAGWLAALHEAADTPADR